MSDIAQLQQTDLAQSVSYVVLMMRRSTALYSAFAGSSAQNCFAKPVYMQTSSNGAVRTLECKRLSTPTSALAYFAQS
eukprot:14992-Heterococcus_DN1.PRE.2